MQGFFNKTFGGLTREYYVRHFLISLFFPALFLFSFHVGHASVNLSSGFLLLLLGAINSLLFPYAYYACQSVVRSVIGERLVIVNVLGLLIGKVVQFTVCWAGAIYIAPFGLASLYFKNRRLDRG